MVTLRYIKGRVKNRRDTKDAWLSSNPLLYDGELAIEQDTNKLKCGDGITKYKDLPYIGGNMPTGTVIPFAGKTIPDDWLLCNGQAVSRTEYSELFEVIGTTYGNGDGNSTFNVPNLIERIPWGVNIANLGKTRDAGLPNITGTCQSEGLPGYGALINGDQTTGCFSLKSNGHRHCATSAGPNNYDIVFNASKSNPIYGRSSTVQPPAVCMIFIIKT